VADRVARASAPCTGDIAKPTARRSSTTGAVLLAPIRSKLDATITA
jgi:hypothetical protein